MSDALSPSLTFALPDVPVRWPRWYRWLPAAHDDALSLFPQSVYQTLRVDHRVAGTRLVVLSDPASIAHVCGSGSKHYKLANLHLRMLQPALGAGLVVAQGRQWTLQRRHAFKLMPQQHEHRIQDVLERRIDATLQDLSGRTVSSGELIDALVALSIDLISISVFKHCEPVAHQRILGSINAHRRNIERMDFMDALGLPPWLLSPRMRRAQGIGHSIDQEIEATIRYASAKAANDGTMPPAVPLSRDFVLSLITGFESVATTSLWLLTILASHPSLQEITRVVANSSSDVPRKLPLPGSALDAALLETLRLFPPLPFIFRQAIQNDETPAGRIQRGALVCISPWLVHRHRALWADPDRFDLARFQGLSKLPEGFMPFGVGARRCVGMGIGYNLIKQIVQRASRSYVLEREGSMPEPRGGVSLRPKDTFSIRFSARAAYARAAS